MRIRTLFMALAFGLAAGGGLAAEPPLPGGEPEDAPRTTPGSTSSYKVRVPYSDLAEEDASIGKSSSQVGQGYAGGASPYAGDSYGTQTYRSDVYSQESDSEALRLARVEKERIEKENRETRDRERLERERQDRERRDEWRRREDREQREREQRERERRTISSADSPIVSESIGDDTALVTIDEFPTDSLVSSAPAETAATGKAEPKVLATLYGASITEEDVAREMWRRRGRETFDWLVGRDILQNELGRLRLSVSDAEVRESLDKHLVVLRKAYPKLRKRDELTRAASGMTLDEYRERTVWSELALRKIMRATLETREEDLRRFFAAVRADYVRPERVLISQIFIAPRMSPDSDGVADGEAWAEAERRIREAHSLLRRENFSDVAKQYGAEGQVGRWAKRGDLLRELEGPAFSIGVGSITTPIRSSLGWHMLMVEEKEDRREPSLDEVRGEVLARYEEERFVRLAGEFMARMKEKALGSGGLVMVDVPEVFAEAQ